MMKIIIAIFQVIGRGIANTAETAFNVFLILYALMWCISFGGLLLWDEPLGKPFSIIGWLVVVFFSVLTFVENVKERIKENEREKTSTTFMGRPEAEVRDEFTKNLIKNYKRHHQNN